MSGVERKVLAATDQVRFSEYTLQAGSEIAWHYHTQVSDWYICRNGIVSIETREPDALAELAPGDMFNVPVLRHHRVRNTGATECRFALVQGVGVYDFNRLTEGA